MACSLTDDETATTHGIITKEGLFEGTISTSLEDFHIEPVSRYSSDSKEPLFHSIIYRTTDVYDPGKGKYRSNYHLLFAFSKFVSISLLQSILFIIVNFQNLLFSYIVLPNFMIHYAQVPFLASNSLFISSLP